MTSAGEATGVASLTDKLGAPLPAHVVILRALQLGDMLCAVPAFRAIRAALPEARITLIGLPWAHEFVQRFSHYLDHFLEFPGFPGIRESDTALGGTMQFLLQAQARRFDLALQMHGNGQFSNVFTFLLGAKRSAGFYLPGLYCPDREHFLPYPSREPEVLRHLRLTEFLGIPSQGEEMEFPLNEGDRAALRSLPEAKELLAGEYICLHPGARGAERRWPAESFARVGDALAGKGLQVVLTGSSGETPIAKAVAERMAAPAVNLAGKTNLGALAALLSDARLLVCNDTGVSHLAAALLVPSVVIFTNSDPSRWAPPDLERHRVLISPRLIKGNSCCEGQSLTQQRCLRDACFASIAADDTPAHGVTAEQVLAEAEKLLRT